MTGVAPTGTAAAPLLELRNVESYYGDSHILHSVSLAVRPSEIIALLGRNGVGKTTTIQTILGLPVPRKGEIRFKGELISGLPTYEIVRRGIGWVPQGHRIFPTLSVDENLQLAAAKARPGRWSLKDTYELFPRLQTRRDARGDTLSGGEQQMLAIARALVQNPDLVLMDEPSEGLSPRLVEEVGEIITRLHEQGVAILLVEQNLNFALSVAQHLLIMNKGSILFSGKPLEIAGDDQLCRQYLGVGIGAVHS
jgi:branched-chain amino acid transport system ATP-binding protein